jgi:hypothetical protein
MIPRLSPQLRLAREYRMPLNDHSRNHFARLGRLGRRCAVALFIAAIGGSAGCRSETTNESRDDAAGTAPARETVRDASPLRTAVRDTPQTADAPAAGQGSRSSPEVTPRPSARRQFDSERLRAAGVRVIAGQHLTLYTDLPPDDEVDRLPAEFDLAIPQWCEYFGVDQRLTDAWHIDAYLIANRRPFEEVEILTPRVPAFRHGYALGTDLWMYEQPTAYYRRHLLLHEGTHAFSQRFLGGVGPPWYAEGMAERLATHRLDDGQIELGYLPASRDEAPMLGRIKLVQDDVAAGNLLSIDNVLGYGPKAHQHNEAYAWCWALVTLLDAHPEYAPRFRRLAASLPEPDLTERFRESFAADWPELSDQWQVFASTLVHGHDIARSAIQFAPGKPLPTGGAVVTIAADRGWQSTGVRLEAGTIYQLAAEGRFQVADEPVIWWSEAGGVTVRYWDGRPLGMLLAAVRSDSTGAPQRSDFLDPLTVGISTTITPERTGTLYLEINDSPAELHDNAGTLTVRVATE